MQGNSSRSIPCVSFVGQQHGRTFLCGLPLAAQVCAGSRHRIAEPRTCLASVSCAILLLYACMYMYHTLHACKKGLDHLSVFEWCKAAAVHVWGLHVVNAACTVRACGHHESHCVLTLVAALHNTFSQHC